MLAQAYEHLHRQRPLLRPGKEQRNHQFIERGDESEGRARQHARQDQRPQHRYERARWRCPVDRGLLAELPGNLQEVLSGLTPGAQVVANALVLQNTAEQ